MTMYKSMIEKYDRLYITYIANGQVDMAKSILEEIERLEDLLLITERINHAR